jgi:hypothetical protein
MHVWQPWHFFVSTRRYPFEAGTPLPVAQLPNPTPITTIPDSFKKSLRENSFAAFSVFFVLS